MIEIYQGHGYNDVSIQFRVDPIDQNRGTARVVFTVNEGIKGAVSRVRFEGNAHFSEKVLRKKMKTKGKTLISLFDKSGRLDETQLQQDLDSIREWYQDHGYIDVDVKDVRKERSKNGPIIITIVINEGPQYHVGKLAVSGQVVASADKIRALVKMKEGSVYSPKQLRDDAKALADSYGSGGYVDVVILPEGTPAGAALIDVHYKIEEGSRSFVQRVNITVTPARRIRLSAAKILVAPGDVFNKVSRGDD